MIEVRLTWPEAEAAAYAGMKRCLLALADDRPQAYGYAGSDPWLTDVEACGSELAVSKATGLAWVAWARWPKEVKADVGDDVQVKHRSREGWDLIAHEDAVDEQRYVLVYGTLPVYRLVGWCYGSFAKQEEFWGDKYSTGRPAFWVPPDRLEPIETLECPRIAVAEPAW